MFRFLICVLLSSAQAWQIRPKPGYLIATHYCELQREEIERDWDFYDFGLVAKHKNATPFYYYTDTPVDGQSYSHPIIVGYANNADYDYFATYYTTATGPCYNFSSGPLYGPIVKYNEMSYIYTPDRLYIRTNVPIPAPRCDIPVSDRRDCGVVGTTEDACFEAGCCWDPPQYLQLNETNMMRPWCFHGSDDTKDEDDICPPGFPYKCTPDPPSLNISRDNFSIRLGCYKLEYGCTEDNAATCCMDTTPNQGFNYGPDGEDWVSFVRFRDPICGYEPEATGCWPWVETTEADPKQMAYARKMGLRNIKNYNHINEYRYNSACEEFTGYTHSKFVYNGIITAYTARACISYLTPSFMWRNTGLYYIRKLDEENYFHLSLVYDGSTPIDCNSGVGEGSFRDRNGVCVYYAEAVRPGNYTTLKLRSISLNADVPGTFTNMPGATFTENSLIDYHSDTGPSFSLLSYPASTHTRPPQFSTLNDPKFNADSAFRVYLYGSNTPISYHRLHGETFEAWSPLMWTKLGTLNQRSTNCILARNKYYVHSNTSSKLVAYTDYVVHRYPWQLALSIVIGIELFLLLIGSMRVIYSTYKTTRSTGKQVFNYTLGGLVYLLLGHLVIIDIAVGILLIIPNIIVVVDGKRYCFLPLSSFAVRKFFKFSKIPIRNYPLIPKLTPLYFSKTTKAQRLGFWKTMACIPFLISVVLAGNPGQSYNPQRVKFDSSYSGEERISTADFEFTLFPVPGSKTTIAGYDQDSKAVFSADITVTDKTKTDYACTYEYSATSNERTKWGFYHTSKELCVCERMKEPQCLIYEKEHENPYGKDTRNKCTKVDFDGNIGFPANIDTVFLGATEIYTRCCQIGMLGRGQRTTLCGVKPILADTHMDVFNCGQMVPTLGINVIIRDAGGAVIFDDDFETQDFATFDTDALSMSFDTAGWQPSPPGRVGVLMYNQDVKSIYAQLESFGISNSAFIKTQGIPTEGGYTLNVKADITAGDDTCRFGQAAQLDPLYLDAQYKPLSTYMNCQVDFLTTQPEVHTVNRNCKQRNAPVTTQTGAYIQEVTYLSPQGTLSTYSCGGHITVKAHSVIASSFDADDHSLTADDITCSKCTGHWGTEQAICTCTSSTAGLLHVQPTDVYTIPLAVVLDTANNAYELQMVFANPYVTHLTLKDGTNVKLPTDDLQDPTEYVPNPDEDSTKPANDPTITDDFWTNLSKILIIIGIAIAIAAGVILLIIIFCNISKSNKISYNMQTKPRSD